MANVQRSWCTLVLDLRSGLVVPRLVTWDPATGEFTSIASSAPVSVTVDVTNDQKRARPRRGHQQPPPARDP